MRYALQTAIIAALAARGMGGPVAGLIARKATDAFMDVFEAELLPRVREEVVGFFDPAADIPEILDVVEEELLK